MRRALPEADLAALEAFAVELGRVAGEVILPQFRAGVGVEDKGAARGTGFDPVTAADRGAEAAIRQAIAVRFPDHGVLGEEYGADRTEAEFVWVLDPIDGTRGFIAGLPLWTTLVALRFQGRPIVGLIAQPYLQESFVGSARGSRLVRPDSERALKTRPCPDLGGAILGATDPLAYCQADEQAAFQRVRDRARLTRLGGDAYHFALVALGTLDLVIEPRALKAWDVEAAIPLIEGAGGRVTDWRGETVGAEGGAVVATGDEACLQAALPLLADAA